MYFLSLYINLAVCKIIEVVTLWQYSSLKTLCSWFSLIRVFFSSFKLGTRYKWERKASEHNIKMGSSVPDQKMSTDCLDILNKAFNIGFNWSWIPTGDTKDSRKLYAWTCNSSSVAFIFKQFELGNFKTI